METSSRITLFFTTIFKTNYFLLFPIPFLSKIGSLDSYDLYKTIFNLNYCFYHFIIIRYIFVYKKQIFEKSFQRYFNLTLFFLFLYGICFTSFEQRHLGPFLINLFFIILIPNYSLAKNKNSAIVGIYFSPVPIFYIKFIKNKNLKDLSLSRNKHILIFNTTRLRRCNYEFTGHLHSVDSVEPCKKVVLFSNQFGNRIISKI